MNGFVSNRRATARLLRCQWSRAFGAYNNVMRTWTEKDFDQLGWHDNYIHSLSIREGEYGSGDLILDIDFILEWYCPPGQICEFLISPATLTFHSVTDLQLHIDYAGSSAATSPMSIDGIEREVRVYPNGHSTNSWKIPINWPAGHITFLASGFMQALRGTPIKTTEQCLKPSQRNTQCE